jgi:hypothetical protein
MPYPAASAALVDGLNSLAGLQLDPSSLREESEGTGIRLARLVAESPEHAELIQELERHADDEAEGNGTDDPTEPDMELRSGDELAAELEQFLREQGD